MYRYNPDVLVVHRSTPVRSVKEFIAYAKPNPDKLYYEPGGRGFKSCRARQ